MSLYIIPVKINNTIYTKLGRIYKKALDNKWSKGFRLASNPEGQPRAALPEWLRQASGRLCWRPPSVQKSTSFT